MSIPCPHVAGSVSDFGDEHPEKYTTTARQCRCIGTGSLPMRHHRSMDK